MDEVCGLGLVGHPEERNVERREGGVSGFGEDVAMETPGFTQLALGAVAIYGVLEMTLRNRKQDLSVVG